MTEARLQETMTDEPTQERLESDFDKGYHTKALEFTPSEFTTFRAEWAWKGDDLVLHFFKPEAKLDGNYWMTTFPNCLSEVAEDFFNASYPRLKAAYAPEKELESWWMQASNFTPIDQRQFVESFLDKLDTRLEPELPSEGG